MIIIIIISIGVVIFNCFFLVREKMTGEPSWTAELLQGMASANRSVVSQQKEVLKHQKVRGKFSDKHHYYEPSISIGF